MKASRLIFTLLLASSVAVVQLAAQQTKADQKPIKEVKAKAEAGDAQSQVELGLRYAEGEGVAKDQVEAVKWFRKAAEQNLAEAQYIWASATQWRRRGERLRGSGEMVSQSRRAELRRGSIQSGRLLRKWRRRGEGSGGGGEMVSQSRRAEFRQGSIQFGRLLLCNGEGVAKDQVEAVKWFRKAAEQNFAEAQYNLGVCYYAGEGVAKDQVEAVKWYRKAAEQNLAEAQYNLGFCYYNGEGVAKDSVEAYKWLLLAARQGDEMPRRP